MITIIDAWAKHGYSREDHLICGDYESLIGQQHRSVRDIRRAVAQVQAETEHRSVRHIPVAVQIRLATGDVREISA